MDEPVGRAAATIMITAWELNAYGGFVIEEIDLSQLKTLLQEGAELVDVREPEELEDGFIEGMKHMPLSDFERFEDIVSKTKPTVFYCRSGRRSLKAAEIAETWTDQPLYSLRGGFLEYVNNQPQ